MSYLLIPKRPIIINGDFNIWQRGTSFAAIADSTYYVDRFKYGKSGAMVHTAARTADVPTITQSGHLSNYCNHLTLTTPDTSIAAGDYCAITNIIEGYDFLELAQTNFTLSFWVKATATGTYCVSFSNSGSDRSYVVEYTINTTETWEKKIINVTASPSAGTWDYINGIGLRVRWALASGSTFQTTANAWQTGNYLATSNQVNGVNTGATNFKISQVKIEKGNFSTRFYDDDIATCIKRCMRYYQKSYNYGTVPGTATASGAPFFRAHTTDHREIIRYLVPMRAAPTATLYNHNSGASGTWRDTGASADRTVTATNTDENNMGVQVVTSVDTNAMRGHFTLDAEL